MKWSLCFLSAALLTSPLAAEELSNRRVPLVVKQLQSRYRLPGPTAVRIEGARAARDLADLVGIEQKYFPGAVVTAGFYDWRTLSRYRSHAGLHLGYDIAMPYGCPFGAGWPGVVTSIVVWSGEEHGITVQSPDGTCVTYGHVAPKVTVGQHVEAGQMLGTIARDHVDVKMRDAAGNYQDFGGSGRVIPAPSWAASSWMVPQPSREAMMAEWLLASNNLEVAREEVDASHRQAAQRKLEIEQLKRRLPVLQKSVEMMSEYVEQGLVARVTAEENREEYEKAKERLKKLQREVSQDPAVLEQQLRGAKERLAQAQSQAQRLGISFKDVENFVNQTVANDKTLQKNVESYKKSAQTKNATRLSKLETQLKDSEKTLKSMEELYEIGGIAKNDVENLREKHKLLVSQLRALKAQTQD